MKKLGFILQKEFKQIFRDKTILAMMFLVPTIQLGIMPLAMNFDVKSINLVIVNNDFSPLSYSLVNKINSSGYFKIVAAPLNYKEALSLMDKGKADVILQIPANFERNLVREGSHSLFVATDAINGTKSGLGSAYLITVINDFNHELVDKTISLQSMQGIEVLSTVWYNPHSWYYLYIVPGVLVLLLTIIGGFLSALNIVKEKEMGTIEQINVTPIKKWQFILGKMIPFWVVGMVVLTIGLLVAVLFYGITIQGNIFLLYVISGIYLVALLGFGLLISTVSNNQLQAMFIAYFFIMIFVLMSGLFTSVESMPGWARQISDLLPISHFMRIVRMIVIKGSGLADVQLQALYLCIFAVVLNALAIWNYRKTSG